MQWFQRKPKGVCQPRDLTGHYQHNYRDASSISFEPQMHKPYVVGKDWSERSYGLPSCEWFSVSSLRFLYFLTAKRI
jgi:hypothetical protein